MAVQSEIFSTEYGVRSFISTKHIATKQHMSVWLQRRSDNIWVQLSTSNYELINNSAVLTQAPNSTTYSQVEIRVADTPDELGSSQSEIAVLAGLYDEIVALNGIKNDITTVAGISGDVTTVSSNILDINSVVTNIVPNLAEILQADTNATIATTKATEASASATSASNSAITATNKATIATTQAGIATIQAGIATTKASEAATHASNALTSENNAIAAAQAAGVSADEVGTWTIASPFSVATIEDLSTIDTTKYTTAIAKDLDRGGTFIWSATGTANGGTVFAVDTGYWNRQYSGAVNVKWFGAVGDGVTDDTVAFNKAAALGTTVVVQKGDYVISSPTMNAMWEIEYGAYIRGLPDKNGVNDTRRLTGRMIKRDHKTGVGPGPGIRIGDSDPWLEKNHWNYSESIAELSVLSSRGLIGLLGASRTSDDPTANYGCIGITGHSVNDNTVNPEPSWALYLNAQRMANTGASYNTEMDHINYGNTFDLDPYTTISPVTEQTVNVWLTAGGGSGVANNVSAAIAIHANPKKFRRGIVFQNGSLDESLYEAIAMPGGYQLAWYSANGTKNSFIDHRQIEQKTQINNSIGNVWKIKKYRDAGTPTNALDNIHRTNSYGSIDGATEYRGVSLLSLQRSNFSEGNARFSYDIEAANGDGTFSSVSLNGLSAKSFHAVPDNSISLGLGGFRWSTIFAASGTINTSDEREKQQIRDLSESERAVAVRLKSLIRAFKFNDAVDKKGNAARIHFGVMAQEVKAAFEAEGLVAEDYSILCYDEWEDEYETKVVEEAVLDEEGNTIKEPITEQVLTVKAGNRYGIRYEELLCFIMSAL